MDASQVIAQLNSTWSSLIDKYYDHIADEYLSWMSNEYNIPLDELKEKAQPVKDKIMNIATFQNTQETSGIKKKAKKPVKSSTDNLPSSNIYTNMSRNELASLCRENGLPVRRKNLDMINSLMEKLGDSSTQVTSQEPESSTQVTSQQPESSTRESVPEPLPESRSLQLEAEDDSDDETADAEDTNDIDDALDELAGLSI